MKIISLFGRCFHVEAKSKIKSLGGFKRALRGVIRDQGNSNKSAYRVNLAMDYNAPSTFA